MVAAWWRSALCSDPQTLEEVEEGGGAAAAPQTHNPHNPHFQRRPTHTRLAARGHFVSDHSPDLLVSVLYASADGISYSTAAF